MSAFALLIFVYQLSGSVTDLSLVLLATSLPALAISPLAGVWVDRLDRRVVMMVADAATGVGALVLLVIAWRSELTFWPILIVMAFASVGGAFQEPAYRASIVTLVPKDNLGRANGMIEMGPAIGMMIAPAAAGAIILTLGIEVVLVIDVITFLVAVATLSRVRFPRLAVVEQTVRSRVRTEMAEGFHYLRERSGLLGYLSVLAMLNFFLTFANVLWLAVFLGFANEAQVGLLMTGIGVSLLAGSLIMSAWGGPKRLVPPLLSIMALSGVLLSLTGLRPSLLVTGAALFAFMVLSPLVNGISQTLWQRKVAPEIQGRVFSIRRMTASIASPLAFILAGQLADRVFEPLLARDGALAESVGQVIGVGAGRGSALLIIIAGLGTTITALAAWSFPAMRNIESDIPDAVVDIA